MEDDRIWKLEKSLWTGDAQRYSELIDDECVMVLPAAPFVFAGKQAIEAVADTPRWSDVLFSEHQVSRPEEGLILIAYKVEAKREGAVDYVAYCTSTIRRLEHDVWRVVQHQQSLAPSAAGVRDRLPS